MNPPQARTYLVGGAVRDELLGLPMAERDWVVTGAEPQHLLDQGFRQVGASFPVFLHPETGEEYALARTERKAGRGYHGFTVEFGPEVTIEQDLERRDLTINAMARDESGRLIDPFGGQADLEQGILRHVSPAFAEDPLRVLRVARFAARFHGMGFTVHETTNALMREIADSGELDHLVAERAWREIERAMGSPHPSVFIETLRDAGALAHLLPEVDALFGVPQPPQYHPEIDTGVHLLMSLDAAAALGCSSDVVVAVLLHDLGKALSDPDRLPSHHGHEAAGLPLVEEVCERFRMPTRTRRLSLQLAEHHLRCHRILQARPTTVLRLLERLDALRRGDVEDFVLGCEADYRGRKGYEDRDYPQGEYLRRCLQAALDIQARDLSGPQDHGPEVGAALRAARLEAIARVPVRQDG